MLLSPANNWLIATNKIIPSASPSNIRVSGSSPPIACVLKYALEEFLYDHQDSY